MGLDANTQLTGGAIFYSQLAKVIEGAPARISNISGSQWAAWLAGNAAKLGVKQAELEWTGILDWLALQPGKVPKDEVLGYLDGNGVRIEETVLGGQKRVGLEWSEWSDPNDDDFGESFAISSNGMYRLVKDTDGRVDLYDEVSGDSIREGLSDEVRAKEFAETDAASGEVGAVPKYGQFTLPGGENYREVLLTLPSLNKDLAWARKQEEMFGKNILSWPDEVVDELDRRPGAKSEAKSEYKSRHWEQPNVLAHIRVNDRVDADGKRVLFVEELQSDWGADGRKKGFFSPEINRLNAAKREYQELVIRQINNPRSITPEDRARIKEMQPIVSGKGLAQDGVPAAPFVQSTEGWLNLALKRVITMAVDGGYDKVAFVTGAQSADRYDLNKQVETISVTPGDDGAYDIEVEMLKGGAKRLRNKTPQEVEDTIGKEISTKAIAAADAWLEADKTYRALLKQDGVPDAELDVLRDARDAIQTEFSGLDLKVGGEGMKAFYDQIVPNVVKDVVKKLGGGVVESVDLGGKAVLPNGWSIEKEYGEYVALDKHGECQFIGYSEQHVLDSIGETGSLGNQVGFAVTEKMRDLVRGHGVPLFQDSRGVFDASTLTVTLLDSADESTFIHEAGHFYLEVLTDVAGQPGAPASVEQDVEAVMDWLGVPGGVDAWKKMPMAEKTPFHEQFARGVEAYFMTGVAPAPQLEGMFSRFAKFLAGIYKSVTSLDVALTPEITSVFDRLVVGSSLEDRAGMDVVQECLASQLAEVDRFPAELNSAYAGMVANFYGAVAGAAGVPVVELAAKYPLEIRSDVHGLVSGGVEKMGIGSEAFKEWFSLGLDVGGQSVPKIAKAGEFSGQVLNVSVNGVVTQRVNRAGDVVQHDAGKLSAPVVKGDVAHIKYVGGVGVVSGRGVGVDVGR